MTGLSLGMIVEGLVALLLMLTIGYCVTLNRRLQRLRADEEMLRATISELITATEIAERAILGLKATANDCEKDITSRLAEASHVSARLSEQVAAGEGVFKKIAQITEAARAPSPGQAAIRPPVPSRLSEQSPLQVQSPLRQTAMPKPAPPPESANPEGAFVPLQVASVTKTLLNAAEQAAVRVQNLRRMTGDRAA